MEDGRPKRPLNLGFVGIGVGGLEILRAATSVPEIKIIAGADVVPATRERFQERFPAARVYKSAEDLCADKDVEAVWIATPNRFHARHAIFAAQNGKHVVVEKPMAISLSEAEQMVEAADKNHVKLLAGHTRSFTLPIRVITRIVRSGTLGKLCAIHIWSYSDWMLRPRTPDELNPQEGGGVPYRQGPHQVDTVRVLGGGKVRSVRGMTGRWMPERPIAGYYCAYLEFEDGTPATIMHNGYGYFLGAELVAWGESRQRYDVEGRSRVRRELRAGTRPDEQDKQDMRIGGRLERPQADQQERRPWVPEDMGMLVVSCERGDLRQSKFGLYVYDDNGIKDVDLGPGDAGRRGELDELYNSVVLSKPVYHDGRWGMATLEVCLAIIQSARDHKEVYLSNQVSVHPDYDSDLELPLF